MNQEERLINGDLLRLRREAQGWVVTDMALRSCLSVKQVRQLEEGGSSAFYSESVKITAAKKVGSLLGLSADEVFVSSSTATALQQDVLTPEPALVDVESIGSHVEAEVPVEVIEEPVQATASTAMAADQPSVNQEVKPKTSLWAITGLFAAALAVAAYMQPKEEPLLEAAPPLQVVPAEAETAASAADVTASSASAASSPTAPASAPISAVAASPMRATSVAANASGAARPANAASGVAPAAPAASKAP